MKAGLQNRSGPYALSARDYLRSGKLGQVVHVKVYNLLGGQAWLPKPDEPIPAGLDWDRWLGPAPEVPHNPARHLGWTSWWDYKGGALADDGRIVDQDKGYFPDKWHQPNFIDCVRSRKAPNAEIEQGHFSACLVHLGNLAYRMGNVQLLFDAKSERFINNEAANRFLKPAYRKQYRVPDEV